MEEWLQRTLRGLQRCHDRRFWLDQDRQEIEEEMNVVPQGAAGGGSRDAMARYRRDCIDVVVRAVETIPRSEVDPLQSHCPCGCQCTEGSTNYKDEWDCLTRPVCEQLEERVRRVIVPQVRELGAVGLLKNSPSLHRPRRRGRRWNAQASADPRGATAATYGTASRPPLGKGASMGDDTDAAAATTGSSAAMTSVEDPVAASDSSGLVGPGSATGSFEEAKRFEDTQQLAGAGSARGGMPGFSEQLQLQPSMDGIDNIMSESHLTNPSRAADESGIWARVARRQGSS